MLPTAVAALLMCASAGARDISDLLDLEALRTTEVEQRDFYPAPLFPQDNQPTPAKIALGKRLFSETALSVTGGYSCASCHDPVRHFTDGRPVALGATGERHEFNTPTLYNVAFNASYGWTDSGLTSLEQQHLVPLRNTDPVEMGYREDLLKVLYERPGYADDFQAVFSAPADTNNVVQAIAAYVRTIRAPLSAFDRYLFYHDEEALSAPARAGLRLFFSERLGCAQCHASLSFSGPVRHSLVQAQPVFHNTGVGGGDRAFRAPTLRQIRHTAPYMHDGSLASLDDVLVHYQTVRRPRIPEFTLPAEERSALLAFLRSL